MRGLGNLKISFIALKSKGRGAVFSTWILRSTLAGYPRVSLGNYYREPILTP